MGGNIAIECEWTKTDAELFGADSAVTTNGSPLVFCESLYPLDEDGYTAANLDGMVRMAWNMQSIYNRVDKLHTFTDGVTRYCRNPEQHDTTCKCIGWELARIKEPKLYKKYVAMHDLKRQEAMRNSWRNLLSGHEVHDFIAY